jgi:hypothetical protein
MKIKTRFRAGNKAPLDENAGDPPPPPPPRGCG